MWPILPTKKKVGKMANFVPKLWVNPFEKMSLFRLFRLFFCRLQRRLFDVEYRKRHFLGPYCPKKKVGKRANFGQKPWVIPFGKMSIFRLFELLVFIGYKGVISFLNILKDILLAYIAPKKKFGRMANFGP